MNVQLDVPVDPQWVCPECKIGMRRDNSDNTPVKRVEVPLSAPRCEPSRGSPERMNTTALDTTLDVQEFLTLELRLLREEMRSTREEFRAFRQEIVEIRTLITTCDARVDGLEAKIEALSQQRGAEVPAVMRSLEATVAQLQLDLGDRDQELLSNDIEISGVPEESGENPSHLVLACAVKLGVTLDERELVSCARVGGVRPAAPGGRPRPLCVRLARRDTRLQLLRAARVRRGLTTEGLGLKSNPTSIHVNERLTKANRRLFYQARESGKRTTGWRFVWTKDGRIYVRRDQGSPASRIRTEADLERVFGPQYVRLDGTNG